MTTPTPGTMETAILTFIGVIVTAVTAFDPGALNSSERTALISVAGAAVVLGTLAFGYFRHSAAMAAFKAQRSASATASSPASTATRYTG